MSRSGYTDDCDDHWQHIRWRGAVRSAINGARGQAFLRELADLMDAMPEKRLIANELQSADGEFCTLGVVGQARGIDMSKIDPEDPEQVAAAFNIAAAMAQEIVFENDEYLDDFRWVDVEVFGPLRPFERREQSFRQPIANLEEKRWKHVRKWVAANLKAPAPQAEQGGDGPGSAATPG